MLTYTFLGVGSAFAKRNFASNVLVEAWSSGPDVQNAPEETLLVDFGSNGPLALHQLKNRSGFEYLDLGGRIDYSRIRRVFITHLHADHIGGLEELATCNRFALADPDSNKPFKPDLYSSPEILHRLWEQSLRGGLSALPGGAKGLEDYFRLCEIEPNRDEFTLLETYRFRAFPTDHLRIADKYDWPSLGLYALDVRTSHGVFFSGDTRFDLDAYRPMFESARVCFHEVQLVDQDDPVHSLLSELRSLPESVRRKMWLYHYSDDWDNGEYDFVPAEFAGFVEPHKRYVVLD